MRTETPRTRFRLVLLTLSVALAATALAGCGSHRDSPETVVARAPATTLATRRALVSVAYPGLTATGDLRPSARTGEIGGRPVDRATSRGPLPQLIAADPYLVIDLIAGRTKVETYGGAEIRGTSTFRYDLTVSPAKALAHVASTDAAPLRTLMAMMSRPTLFLDVWVDNQGRIRHLEIPANPNDKRPGYLGGRLVDLVTIDLYGFQ